MDPHAELDQALTAHLRGAHTPHSVDLEPLLQAADRLRPGASAMPSSEFAAALQARILARAEQLAAGAPRAIAAPPINPRTQASPRQAPSRGWPRMHALPAAMLAATLLIVIGSTLALAAAAPPGSSLYGLRRLEQGLQSQLSPDAASRARLHLTYAREALAALTQANERGKEDTYRAALATLSTETREALAQMVQVPAGAQRNSLSAEIAAFRAEAARSVKATLTRHSWPARAKATTVIGELGVTVLQVSKVRIVTVRLTSGLHGTSTKGLRIVVEGSGFQPGAVILLDGQALGTMISVSATQAVALVPGSEGLHPEEHAIGVGNPDGTATYSTRYESSDESGKDSGNGTGDPTDPQEPPSTPTPEAHAGERH